jgi:hypothetical protein
MPEAEAKHNVVMRHCLIRLVMQATHRYHSSDIARSGDIITDLINIRVKEVIHSVQVSVHHEPDRDYNIISAKLKSHWNDLHYQSKVRRSRTEDISKVPYFINLGRSELLLYFYYKPKGHYKNITEIKSLQEAQKD